MDNTDRLIAIQDMEGVVRAALANCDSICYSTLNACIPLPCLLHLFLAALTPGRRLSFALPPPFTTTTISTATFFTWMVLLKLLQLPRATFRQNLRELPPPTYKLITTTKIHESTVTLISACLNVHPFFYLVQIL